MLHLQKLQCGVRWHWRRVTRRWRHMMAYDLIMCMFGVCWERVHSGCSLVHGCWYLGLCSNLLFQTPVVTTCSIIPKTICKHVCHQVFRHKQNIRIQYVVMVFVLAKVELNWIHQTIRGIQIVCILRLHLFGAVLVFYDQMITLLLGTPGLLKPPS